MLFLRECGGILSCPSVGLYLLALAKDSVDHYHTLELHLTDKDVMDFKQLLVGEGYGTLPGTSRHKYWLDHPEGRRHIHTVEAFQRGGQCVILFTSPTPSVVCSIFSQRCGAGIASIAVDYVFIGYPWLTLSHRATINPWMMDTRMTERFILHLRQFLLFDIAHLSAAWDLLHDCFHKDGCPWADHSSEDSVSLFFDSLH